MPRFATIDIGTNSVLLLVAERSQQGPFIAVKERAEVTRLGRNVDATHKLSEQGMAETLATLERFADEARALGAEQIAVSATSAARDASNGALFLEQARTRANVTVEIISGELEAELSFAAVRADFASGSTPLLVIDIGGGSTEFIYGAPDGTVAFRRSFDVGSVRLTERFIRTDPPQPEERAAIEAHLHALFENLPQRPAGAVLVGVAGTVTTLLAVDNAIDPYDAAKIHGATLTLEALEQVTNRLLGLPLAERQKLPGLQPKRADVICAGALILLAALRGLKLDRCTVSDRGLRWGLLAHRFGAAPR